MVIGFSEMGLASGSGGSGVKQHAGGATKKPQKMIQKGAPGARSPKCPVSALCFWCMRLPSFHSANIQAECQGLSGLKLQTWILTQTWCGVGEFCFRPR